MGAHGYQAPEYAHGHGGRLNHENSCKMVEKTHLLAVFNRNDPARGQFSSMGVALACFGGSQVSTRYRAVTSC